MPLRLPRRFVIAYVLLYFFPPHPDSALVDSALEPLTDVWARVCAFVGAHLLGIPADRLQNLPSGSGDRTLDYVSALVIAIAAAVVATIWHVVQRRRIKATSMETTPPWVYTYARYALAFVMLGYGFAKIIPVQFGELWLDRLLQPIGLTSPMGMLWSLMSASPPYTRFGGIGEVVGGLLLLWRRTALAGAIVVSIVMANVVALNLAYDVPVKLYSAHLFLLALFIIDPHARRLLAALFPPAESTAGTHRLPVRVLLAFATAAVALGLSAHYNLDAYREDRAARAKGPLYGMYDVEQFRINAREIPPSLLEPARWRRMVVSGNYGGSVRLMNDTVVRYRFELDSATHTVVMRARGDTSAHAELHFAFTDSQHLALTGMVGRDSMRATLRRVPIPDFLLLSRGFRWVNEQPFNR